jgi:hypothetical protein
MAVRLLNDNQQRRLGTHLSLLVSDLEALAESPELQRDAGPYTRVRDALDATRRAAEALRAALALPPDRAPGLQRRVAAVADVWAARMEDLHAHRLTGYGPVHPDLGASLDPGVEEVRRRLEALGAAARGLPEGAA